MADSSSAAEIQAVPAPEAKAPPPPVLTFDSFPVSDEIKAGIRALGYITPTDVQAAVITPAVQGRDVVVQAKTGSGKTCAFGVPLLDRVARTPAKPHEPHALVLAPTRELAHQVSEELRALGAPKGLKVHAIYGGVPMGKQIAALNSGVDVVSGTPGRILDHLRRKNMSFDSLEVIVLDEADEMLSLGFFEDVTRLCDACTSAQQTIVLSASLDEATERLVSRYAADAERVDLSADTLSVEGIGHRYYTIGDDLPKHHYLLYVLQAEQPSAAIVFVNTRSDASTVATALAREGHRAEMISGELPQKERERVMASIRSGELKLLVATDLAARGIDISHLSHVINYSLPEDPAIYLHRVGRTGRVGRRGTAVSLVSGARLRTLGLLERHFQIHFEECTFPPREEMVQRRNDSLLVELVAEADRAICDGFLGAAEAVLAHPSARQIVALLLKRRADQVHDTKRSVDNQPRRSPGPGRPRPRGKRRGRG